MQSFLEIGLSNAVMATALALVAGGVGLCCRRPPVRHTLWLLVLLKLVTPPVISIPVSCPSALEAVLREGDVVRLRAWPLGVERGDPRQAAAHEPANPADEGQVPHHPDPSPAAAVASPDSLAGEEDRVATVSEPASGLAIASFLPLVFTVWLSGAVLWFAVAGTRIYRFQRLLGYGRAAPPALQDETCLLADRLGLARCPTVWLVPGRVSPLLWALGGKAFLVVPADLLDRLGPGQRASLLAHELAHARRRDHWVRWLEFVVSGLYWWLPVAWWARRQLQQAEEECCDAWVVWTLPAVAKAYAKALLQTVDFLDARPALPPVASGVGHVHLLKRRLTMIVRQPLCPCLPWPVHLGVVVLGLLVLPFAPQRLAAQGSEAKPAPELSDDTALVRAEQDPANREMERRLRALEEKMDRLLQKLDAQRGERSEGKTSGPDREEKAKAKEKEKAEKGREKTRADRMKESTWRFDFDGKTISPEQIAQLKKEIQEKVNKALDPERMKEIHKRVQEAVDKSISPERLEAIQRKVEEALKKSAEELDRAKQRLQQAEQRRDSQPRKVTPPRVTRPERSGDQEPRDLERRMDRLEEKMDRVLQALEKSGKPSK